MIGWKEPSKQAHRERSGSHHPTSHASLGRLYPPQGARAVMPKCVQALPPATLGELPQLSRLGEVATNFFEGVTGPCRFKFANLVAKRLSMHFPGAARWI